MKTMKIEKHLLFADEIAKVHHLQVSDGLTYHQETLGIRAKGPLYIKGEYETINKAIVPFEEVLEMDVLAPNDKLGGQPFLLQVEEYNGIRDVDGIDVTIYLSIRGLKDQDREPEVLKKETVEKEEVQTSSPQAQVSLQEASTLETNDIEKVDSSNNEGQDIVREGFEDLFEDAGTTYTSYRMIVAKVNDTYASIANRYEVGEEALQLANHNKDIQAKTLVILPSIPVQ